MSNILITSDLHLTDQPNDNYRFDFLTHLEGVLKKEKIDNLFFLGDITDRKNSHSAELVNIIINHLAKLAKICPIHILFGNHDGISSELPYFLFLNKGFKDITMYAKPTQIGNDVIQFGYVYPILMLPHSRDPITDWKDLEFNPKTKLIFMHQTITGSQASNGAIMEGLSTEFIKNKFGKIPIISGDIHVPQTLGTVTYVGSPYHVHFGDHKFEPRYFTMDLKTNKISEHNYDEAPRKIRLTVLHPNDLKNYTFKSGDQIKIDLKLYKADWVNHDQYKKAIKTFCDDNNLLLKGIMIAELDKKESEDLIKQTKQKDVINYSPKRIFKTFCNERKVDSELINLGESFL